jgi:hypothetical protein
MSANAFTAHAAQLDEHRTMQRLKSLQKARQALARRVAAQRRDEEHARREFKQWLRRERLAYETHAAQPDDHQLLRAWRKILAERPALYGRREQSAA